VSLPYARQRTRPWCSGSIRPFQGRGTGSNPVGRLLPSDALDTLSIVKTVERELARALRRDEGASIKEIARRVGVSISSVSHWVRDIELTPQQDAQLLLRNPAYNRQRSGTWIQAARRRTEREAYQNGGRARARHGDVSFVAGCMLYWAEGAKGRNQLQFANSDPEVVRFFVDFLRTHFDLSGEEIRITCHLYADHAISRARSNAIGSRGFVCPRRRCASPS
jgi:AcrR family transcriptional regulator